MPGAWALIGRLLAAAALAVEPVKPVVPIDGVHSPAGAQAGAAPVLPAVQPTLTSGRPAALALPAPAIVPVTAASLNRPVSRPRAAAADLAGATGVSEDEVGSGQRKFDLAAPAPSAQLGALDVLEAERPGLLADRIHRIREIERVLVEAVSEAASRVIGEPVAAVSRGSTARLTNDEDDADYDLMVRVPKSWDPARSRSFLHDDPVPFVRALWDAANRRASELFPGRPVMVKVEHPRPILDPATKRWGSDIAMVPLRIVDTATGRTLVDSDVSLTDSDTAANDYPALFAEQMRRVSDEQGAEAVERLLADIRLAKKFFRTAVGAYKTYQGGPGGVGIEQMVIHAGSFDKMVGRLHQAAFDERGQPRAPKNSRRVWSVPNPYMAPANFLDLLSDGAWRHVGRATKGYLEARAQGRPVTLAELHRKKPPAPGVPAALGPELLEHPTRPTEARELRLQVRVSKSSTAPKSVERMMKRLSRRLRTSSRPQIKQGSKGLWSVSLRLRPEARTEAEARRALTFFAHEVAGGSLVSLSKPAAPMPVAEPEGPGKTTLEMLERFTVSGPRPAERGEAYLWAQGAKAIAPELEESWRGRLMTPLESEGGQIVRTLLQRRDGRSFIRVPVTGDEGRERARNERVSEELVQGLAADALVEARVVNGRVSAVRPIGAYPVDMMIGRVARRGRELVLEGLFQESGRMISAYGPLRIASGKHARVGAIVQAFVRPSGRSYEAVPLLDLGGRVTPEIASREVAFRYGARGYFDRDVIEQVEETARTHDPAAEFEALRKRVEANGKKVLDLRGKPFVTIDPKGAGDLDDAFYIERDSDGGWTWYLATADVAHFVKPGTQGFRAAARIGNTFYSIDKEGVPEFPMNHPVVSKSLASLLSGKPSLAMVTAMRFDKDGKLDLGRSDVSLGIIEVQGRYDYGQVSELWRGKRDTGIEHADQINLARELSRGLKLRDDERGKLDFLVPELRHHETAAGWKSEEVLDDPLTLESHRLIEELKVYGNRVIATRLMRAGVPHISRVHKEQSESVNDRLREDLREIGVPWTKGTLSEYLAEVRRRPALTPEQREVAQTLALTSRKAAVYAADDSGGHEGLALEGGAYDHPSAPIRRFSDMYNRAVLEATLAGDEPKTVYAAVLADLNRLGFRDFDEYLEHLNGRAKAARQMDYEVDEFMSAYELAKPENRGRTYTGYVKFRRRGAEARAVIALDDSPASFTLRGGEAERLRLLERVEVQIEAAHPDYRSVKARVRRRRN